MNLRSRTADAAGVSPPQPPRPAVLGTSRIVTLMELAAARTMTPRLRDGEATIAIDTDLRHLAHSSVGPLRVKAKEQGASGRLHRFTVNVFDSNGLVASGAHTRAVVSTRRLLGIARRRAGKPSMRLDV